MTGPFEQSAELYRDAGMGPIALPHKAKFPPVEGCTGKVNRGVYVTTDKDIQFQAEQQPNGNIGVRLPEDIIGIDIDVRHGGDTTLALLEADLGVLPPTLHSTSRVDGSRIAYYRVPTGEVWKEIGDGIDTIHWGYRYGVCWPSIHPETGDTYSWYDGNRTAYPGVPEGGWDSAAELPGVWIERFQAEEDLPERADLPPLRTDQARRRAQGVLRWLGDAVDGERNTRIYATAIVLGGLWSRLPDDCDKDDLTEEALTEAARGVFADIGVDPDEWKANDTFQRGWEAGARNPAADVAWQGVATDQDGTKRKRVSVDVTNADDAYKEMCRALGTQSLSGVFRRDNNLVHTPRIDEDGYVPLTDGRREYEDGTVRYDEDGPAQVRRLDIPALRAYAAHHAHIFKWVGGHHGAEMRAALLPAEVAGLLIGAPEYVTGARVLRAVAHTPLVLADCTVLSSPGYDGATGILYLPELDVPVPGGEVTREQVDAAVGLIDLLLGPPGCGPDEGFPFVTLDDRATYVAALLTPMLSEIVGPPYPMIAIGAPAPGSGKSYLAWALREVHGGVFRAEMPRSDEELRKQITSILDQTTGRVVTFDNLSGTFASARFDGLLTSNEWTDRLLGSNTDVQLTNDRLWSVTGNNLRFGGDMRRRVRWVTIDAQMAHPEERTFAIDLKPWVREHRGDLLGALLMLIVGWCQAGQPVPVANSSDDFTRWTQVTQGILAWAGVEGVVGGSVREGGLEESEDAEVLDVIRAAMANQGMARWTAGDLLRASELDVSLSDVLPRPAHGGRPNEKSLGRWLSRYQDRVTETGLILRKQGKRWWLDWSVL